MPRSDAHVSRQDEANLDEFDVDNDDEPGPILVPIHRAERSFRWLHGFRNEPRFEIAAASSGGNGPDRAA